MKSEVVGREVESHRAGKRRRIAPSLVLVGVICSPLLEGNRLRLNSIPEEVLKETASPSEGQYRRSDEIVNPLRSLGA